MRTKAAGPVCSPAWPPWPRAIRTQLKVKIETETAVIKDDSIALAVLGKMGMLRLKNPDRFSKEPGPQVSADALPAAQREALVGAFEGHLKVAEVGSSRLITITFSDHDPQVAAQMANQVVAEYKSYLLSSNFNSSKDVSQWLSAQLGDLSGQVTKTQQAVAEFERTHNLSAAMLGLATLSGGSSAATGGGGGGGGAVRYTGTGAPDDAQWRGYPGGSNAHGARGDLSPDGDAES